jgi:hypothetical protein
MTSYDITSRRMKSDDTCGNTLHTCGDILHHLWRYIAPSVAIYCMPVAKYYIPVAINCTPVVIYCTPVVIRKNAHCETHLQKQVLQEDLTAERIECIYEGVCTNRVRKPLRNACKPHRETHVRKQYNIPIEWPEALLRKEYTNHIGKPKRETQARKQHKNHMERPHCKTHTRKEHANPIGKPHCESHMKRIYENFITNRI